MWFAVFRFYYCCTTNTAVFHNTMNTVITGEIVRVMNLAGMIIVRLFFPCLPHESVKSVAGNGWSAALIVVQYMFRIC